MPRLVEQTIQFRPTPWGAVDAWPPLPVRLGIPFNEFVRDLRIFRALELVKFEGAVAREIDKLFAKTAADLAAGILRAGPDTVTRTMRAEIAVQVAELWSAATGRALEEIEAGLSATLRHEAAAAGELRAVWDSYRRHPVFSALPEYQVPNIGAFVHAVRATDPNWFLADFANDAGARTLMRARREVLSAFLQGQSVPQLARTLRATIVRGGEDYQRIARTSLHRIAGDYHRQLRIDNRDIISREKYSATLDTRTCPICGNYDGKTYRTGDGPPVPVHDNCRCVYVPLTKSVRELLGLKPSDKLDPEAERLRRSMDGSVPATVTWRDWIASQEKASPGFALPILGRTRYDAWLGGELELGDLTSRGRILTLASLGLD